MRVALLLAEMGIGGAERIVAELARELAARDVEVAVVAAPGPLDAQLEAGAVTRFELSGRGRSPLTVARSVLELRRALTTFEPTLVHSHNVKATGFALAAQLPRRRRPLLATYHGVTPREARAAAMVLRGASRVACVSEALCEQLRRFGIPERRTSVVLNAVASPPPLTPARASELDRELGLGDGPVISIVGRLAPQKAHDRFLEAARRIAGTREGARFLIVGDGPLRADVERRVRELGLDGTVLVTGARNDARDLIGRSDLLVFSSHWEGLSVAALEALAAGTPVVSTDVAGMRELLADGAGEVVEHDPGALAAAVASLLADPERRAAMAAAGRELIERRFGVERMVSDYLDLYRMLVTAREAP